MHFCNSMMQRLCRTNIIQKIIPTYIKPHIPCLQRMYHKHKLVESDDKYVVDLRSDTVTKPSQRMREAMAKAEVGDDVMGEDPTVNLLQKRIAKLFGKEAALIVPTGTMGNLISVMTHCNQRGQEIILGDKCHIFVHEQGGLAQLAGVLASVVENKRDGTMDVNKVKERIRLVDDPHFPYTKLICVENTHNYCGGKVIPLSFMQEIYELAQAHGLKVHLDGARLMHAVTALQVSPSEILQYTDSVTMCFSKGMSCPVGSVIAGTKDFITKAQRARKALGGGMRQAGVLAAAALYSLDNVLPRLHEDHQHAQMVVKGIMTNKNDIIYVDVDAVQTNIVFIEVRKEGITATDFYNRLLEVTEEEARSLGESIIVKTMPYTDILLRFVLHNDITRDDVDKVIKKFTYIIDEYARN